MFCGQLWKVRLVSCFCPFYPPAQVLRQAASYILDVGWGCGSKCRHCEVSTIHRFVHQSACHESSGHVSTAKFHGSSGRVFSDIIPKVCMHNIIEILCQKRAVAVVGRGGHWAGTGFGKGGDGDGMGGH